MAVYPFTMLMDIITSIRWTDQSESTIIASQIHGISPFRVVFPPAPSHGPANRRTCAMRDYALTQSAAREDVRGLSLLRRLWLNFTARRALVQLQSFDDHLLADLGVTRADVDWAAGLPLTVNAAAALEERSSQWRRARHRKDLAA
jgi:uncharacterized protein YjiS (DUF1127 family)